MLLEKYINTDYEKAKDFYSQAAPSLVGSFTLSQEDAQTLPLSLDEVYTATFETLDSCPDKAKIWAKTFGSLSVNVALNNSPTCFKFENAGAYKASDVAEIATVPQETLTQLFQATETDSSIVFLLAENEQPVSVEMGLIQALHMVDTAIVTSQYTGEAPLILAADPDGLAKIRQDFPETLLRVYGNVRGVSTAPKLLGTVVPTSTLEASGIETMSFNAPQVADLKERAEYLNEPRDPAVFIGITTAKKPHLGHGLLITKAIAEAGRSRGLVIELNDRGPRVAQALATLATQMGESFEATATKVTNGEIEFDQIEQAYKKRGDVPPPDVPPDFSLSKSNAYYKKLLTSIMPPGLLNELIADSELGKLEPGIVDIEGYTPLFNGGGMALLKGAESKAVVVENKGQLTVAGILATLSSRYALKLVDSPPPISGSERSIFKEAGVEVEQTSATGIMIDFKVSSGTNGNTILLEDLAVTVETKTGNPKLLLPALRKLMNGAYFLPSDGESLSVNFASKEAALAAFELALAETAELGEPYESLYNKLSLRNIKRDIVKSLLTPLNGEEAPKGKPTVGEIKLILQVIPSLKQEFSEPILGIVSSSADSDGKVIPKNLFTDKDRQIVQTLRSATPDKTIDLLLPLQKVAPEQFDKLVVQSGLPEVMKAMGYDKAEADDFLTKLKPVKGIYKVV